MEFSPIKVKGDARKYGRRSRQNYGAKKASVAA
jgi:hypothetical protein